MLESGSWGHSILQTPALVELFCQVFLRGVCVWGGGGGVQAAQARVSYPTNPHPFLFREKQLMVHFMIIQMTVQ